MQWFLDVFETIVELHFIGFLRRNCYYFYRPKSKLIQGVTDLFCSHFELAWVQHIVSFQLEAIVVKSCATVRVLRQSFLMFPFISSSSALFFFTAHSPLHPLFFRHQWPGWSPILGRAGGVWGRLQGCQQRTTAHCMPEHGALLKHT